MRWRVNKPALKGLITMLGGSTANAARFMSATSPLMMCIESRQRFILHGPPPSGGYEVVTRMMCDAFPDAALEGLFPIQDRKMSLEGTRPWVSEPHRFVVRDYLRRVLVPDTLMSYAGLTERARLAGGLPLASTLTWSAVCLPARNALKRSVSKVVYAEYGDAMFAGLWAALPALVCCIVAGDDVGIQRAKAVLKLYTTGWLPLGHFPCGNSRAFLTK